MRMDYTALLPEVVLLAAAVITLLAGSYLPRRRQILTRWFTLGALLTSASAALIPLGQPATEIFTRTYAIDTPTTVIRLLVPLSTAVVILIGRSEFSGTPRESETYALLLLATLGTVVVAGTTDLLVLMAGYLLASIPLYALIGLSRTARAAEATLKTYLMGALFGVLLLAGITLLTALGSSSSYPDLTRGLEHAPPAAIAAGFVAVIIGLLFKAGGVPGHFWIPDAAESSSPAIAAFLTTIPKLGALIALARLVPVAPSSIDLPLLIAVLAALSMTVGNLAALAQTNIRRLLGWSTVSQVGYLLMPVAVITTTPTASGALLTYLVLYALTNLTVFGTVACLPRRKNLTDWAGVARSHPWLTGTLIVGSLSLLGTPPTAVFAGKLLVFTATWSGGLAWLVIIAAANTVLSLVYYLRLLISPFQTPATIPDTPAAAQTPKSPSVMPVILGIAVIVAGPIALGIGLL
ncbi:NADH-quinone oxidoreductase subunit N [Subtercola boreus]|uniref:NADH-quinone oxidoreductase subunit N n=1 Tax=Subtercola boreus TaxID=120213 RepID=A0A3E0W1V1_9MICO|nr:NADH-quinone oxidoreductase subunit N [Subtercola boreus]RFA15558.1 NADH-quinone oxidoreductase subunit N [Subtercola boreus]